MPQEWIKIAKVSKTHGVKGAFFVICDDHREQFGDYKQIKLVKMSNEILETSVEKSYVSAKQPVLVLKEIKTKEEAENWRNANVYISSLEINLPKENDDEYLVSNLVGMKIKSHNNEYIGIVIKVVNFGAQDCLELQIDNVKEPILFPFVDEFIVNVDLQNKEIELKNIENFIF